MFDRLFGHGFTVPIFIALVVLIVGACVKIYRDLYRPSIWKAAGIALMFTIALIGWADRFGQWVRWDRARTGTPQRNLLGGQTSSVKTARRGPATDYQAGWIGQFEGDGDASGVSIRLTILPADASASRKILALLGDGGAHKIHAVATVAVKNASRASCRLDLASTALYFDDGTETFAPNPADVLAHAPAEHQQELRAFKPPYVIPAGGGLMDGVIFFPADYRGANLDHVRLTLNGAYINIRGRAARN